ncbi:hypothetical protein BATDEDRAFT_89555 [Batrachochytrium dendrobatidis JAM81]|uniref:VPS9 domain-containing protein n=2 Tax=Batrachochytrium dendrobatidis TaxID=109871 RepID=F4P5T3_BATDJ|nr:uncharacterized protein BATDEDRAFT_89555 [Batrachochytrium dendrobatidis JAM81]EGF79479.1 hypothetical protein BATDEDRAFT_89555 [Batrachochytrium dendrobatidis JAM81]KAJ8322811.1 hypothetical protein O5D80_008341 [Batrachochytrium dendrobatidis]KAK5665872.1 hypothetical protein QVD99_007498 [Batrachochytrium dendrobatidis]OAJ42811.1 hypothetical protein BDEG_26222 [Batrachochytrium dendrobatidis JEL423]|eukprot:XP_006680171.1 hypothetical protein BATDEDRAFT_89555 [Batrachochytrium dendrobatidis JAM81]
MTVDFDRFVTQLRHKNGADLTAQLKAFLTKFSEHPNILQGQRKLISSFLEHIYTESITHAAFQGDTEDDPVDVENIQEGWEKLVMSKVYDRVFCAANTDEHKSNMILEKKFETFGFIEERHLDIGCSFNLSLEVAQAELLRINGYKSPRDKLVILQNVLQLVVDLIKRNDPEGDNAGNDNLLPTLILVFIRAKPPKMISNIKYIMRFRNAHELEQGSNQYCITNVMGVISFIYNMNAKSLTLTEEEQEKMGVSLQSVQLQQQQERQQWGRSTTNGAKEFNRIAGQVSQFFGSIFKEVKTMGTQAAEDLAGLVSSEYPAVSPSESQSSPTALPMLDKVSIDSSTREYPLQDYSHQPIKSPQEQEFELQLAMALSLSEKETSGSMTMDHLNPVIDTSIVGGDSMEHGNDSPSLEQHLQAIDEAVERRKELEASKNLPSS